MKIKLKLQFVLICILLFQSVGCISTITVKKFTGSENGIRYSLPALYLLVTPNTDGTANYSWVYLPDPDNQYVITAQSILSKYKIDISIENNLLKKVNTKPDSAAVASKTLDTIQSIETAKNTAALEAAKTKSSKLLEYQKTLTAAEIEQKQAEAELAALEANPKATNEQLLAAQVKVAQTKAKVEYLKKNIGQYTAFNAPGAGGNRVTQAWGPILFKVVQTKKGVKLIAVNIQSKYDTTASISINNQRFLFTDTNIFTKDPKITSLEFKISADPVINKVGESSDIILYKDKQQYDDATVNLNLKDDSKTILVHIEPFPSAGSYEMCIPYSSTSDEELQCDFTIRFTVK